MGMQGLAEAIILQSLEDIWSVQHREESIEFFTGEGFHLCAGIAGMPTEDKLKVLGLVQKAAVQGRGRRQRRPERERALALVP